MFCVLLTLMKSTGISGNITALRGAAILAMEWIRFVTFEAIEQALSGRLSFVIYTY